MSEILQQLINGLALGAIYALIALGYTMVYGVLRFINFAHGDVFMLGAFAGYFLAPAVARAFPAQSYTGGALVLALAMVVCAVLGIIETIASGIPGLSNYRDGIAFAILILILLFRPAGLLGRLQPEKV